MGLGHLGDQETDWGLGSGSGVLFCVVGSFPGALGKPTLQYEAKSPCQVPWTQGQLIDGCSGWVIWDREAGFRSPKPLLGGLWTPRMGS